MKFMKTHYKLFPVLIMVVFASCKDLTELNVNPNAVDPTTVNPNFMVPTVITATALPYQDNNYQGDVAGAMSYVQKSGWGSGLNNFTWVDGRDWGGYYGNLRNIYHLIDRSKTEGMEFQEGLGLVLKAFNFGQITDGWGDAPYTAAVNAAGGTQADLFPAFDTQETIYKGIIADLKSANTLLSKSVDSYKQINQNADVLYSGDPAKWRKFANSLLLRYYMRISGKLPDVAKAGIEEIMANPAQYPIFTSNDDNAEMAYTGNPNQRWPANTVDDAGSSSNFTRLQLCSGFRDILTGVNDPRISVWFNKVILQVKISKKYAPAADVIVDNVRFVNPDSLVTATHNFIIYNKNTWAADNDKVITGANGPISATLIDTAQYVGLPLAFMKAEPMGYNLNPTPKQGGANVSVSAISDMFKATNGDMLKAKIISYSEVCFILAEAAQKGYSVGAQKSWYEKGIQASLNAWGVGDSYSSYIKNAGVAFDSSLKQIITQKYIANYQVAMESWCDWRRTGFPVFSFGTKGQRLALPIRFRYDQNELNQNGVNAKVAIDKLVQTAFTAQDGNDSSWSKMWLLQ
jgi:Starch-binding associating with outer membrane/Susd and RagB outer membrane lipoprotein